MSWQARLLNRYLRRFERRHLARAAGPAELRRAFEIKARLFFHPPRGTRFDTVSSAGHDLLRIVPRGADPSRVILYFHGGGYVFGSPRTHRAMVARLARAAGATALLPRYPLAPEHSFPAAPTAARAIWDNLAATRRGRDIVIGGDSAGGGLALSLLGQLCAQDVPRPAGVFAFSPLTDLTCSGASFEANADLDVVLPPERSHETFAMVLDGAAADDPLASPLFAGFGGAPPVWLCAGDTEILLDDTRRMAARLRAQGVDVDLHIARDLPHVWPIFHNILPEANATLDQLAGWLRRRWRWPDES